VCHSAHSGVTTISYDPCVVSAALLTEFNRAIRTVQRVVRDAAPGSMSGDEALRIVGQFAELERAAASGIARFTPVVIETGSYAKTGHASAQDWLGAVSGSSASAAKARLAAAERAASVPILAEALRDGDLSTPQLKVLADASAIAPEAPATLLSMLADQVSHQELADSAARLRSAARCKESARARRARVHAQRHFRWHQDDEGGIRGEFFCDEVEWTRVFGRLEADTKARWKAAGADWRESMEAHRLDAFIDLLSRSGRPGSADSGAHTLVIVDAHALKRGRATGDELCEIDGIGPVCVEAATELLGEGTVQFIIRDGVDIRSVTKSSRSLAQRTEMALLVRDRICVVPGCGKRLGLEGDHCEVDYSKDGPTTLGNLARLCGPHHAMKTHGGWRLTGGPGRWSWVPPPRPPTAGRIARSRRLAAAKGKAKANRIRD